jgi:hypothetical protein
LARHQAGHTYKRAEKALRAFSKQEGFLNKKNALLFLYLKKIAKSLYRRAVAAAHRTIVACQPVCAHAPPQPNYHTEEESAVFSGRAGRPGHTLLCLLALWFLVSGLISRFALY